MTIVTPNENSRQVPRNNNGSAHRACSGNPLRIEPSRGKTIVPVPTILCLLLSLFICISGCHDQPFDYQAEAGWAVGDAPDFSCEIFHTRNGGMTWEKQDPSLPWSGTPCTDISAVDAMTAWASLGGGTIPGGMIIYTRNGGATWTNQALPLVIPDGVKGIRGISRTEAWAVGLKGPIMHTVDGGNTWRVVPTPGITLNQVNRMDVLGDDIWIADFGSGANGMIHSPDGGVTWRREFLPGVLPGHGPMTASIVNSSVAWTSVNLQGDIYRTLDGGLTWNIDAPNLLGPNDIDDVCAVLEDSAWMVQNTSGGGNVAVITFNGAAVSKKDWFFPDYIYEGVSAFDTDRAWIVGFRSPTAASSLPMGSILHTDDGGGSWVSQRLPADDVGLWKVSFVGARR